MSNPKGVSHLGLGRWVGNESTEEVVNVIQYGGALSTLGLR